MALFGGIGLCSVLYIVMSLVFMALPDVQMNLGDGSSINLAFGLIGLGSLLENLLRLCVVVMFLIWEYRAFSNLSALRAEHLEFSPGWAVGWWFIPFANLVKPFQAIRELWNESDPDFEEETVFRYKGGGAPALIGCWWAAFLLSNITNRISNAMIDSRTGTPHELFPVALIIASLFQIAAVILVILVVKGITQRQEQRFAKIQTTGQFAPPSPNFYQNG